MKKYLSLSSLLLVVAGSYAFAEDAVPAESKSDATQFMRVRRVDDKPAALETAIVRYALPPRDRRPAATVDLIGAVHVADKSYFDHLNKVFTNYDALLYELVAAENVVPTKDGGRSRHPVSSMQTSMKSMLELEFQLDCIDYTKSNFIHADMTPEEFAKTMKQRDESFFKMFLRMIGQGIAEQSSDPGRNSDREMFMALFAKDRAARLKRVMAVQFEDMDGQLAVVNGQNGSTIITERNKKALAVLHGQLDAGRRRLGIFSGAGHLADMEERLVRDFGAKLASHTWVPAWKLD